jgi:hypothetical protein
MTMTSAFALRARSPTMTDQQEYRLLFAVTFVMFLVAALVLRLLPAFGGGISAGGPKSLFAQAKATSSSALAFAFMG